MPLRSKIATILLLVVAAYVVLDSTVQRIVVLPAFVSLEEEQAEEDVARCIAAIHRELDSLGVLCQELASRSDLLDLLRIEADKHADYPDLLALEDRHLNLLSIYDSHGNPIVHRAVRWRGGALAPVQLPSFPDPAFHGGTSPAPGRSARGRLQGIADSAEGPLLVASRPMKAPDGESARAGTLVLGRLLTEELLDRLSRQTRVSFRVKSVDNDSETTEKLLSRMGVGNPFILEKQPEDAVRAGAYLADINGRPAFQLEAQSPADVRYRGRLALRFALISILEIGLLLLLVLMFVLRRTVSKPLADLTRHIVDLRASETGAPHDSETLDDGNEIAHLTREFNCLMVGLRQHETALTESERKYRTLFDASADALLLENRDHAVTDCNPAATAMFACDRDELFGKEVPELLPQTSNCALQDVPHSEAPAGKRSVEGEARRSDGTMFTAAIDARPVQVAGQQMTLWSIRDITEQKRAREVLIEREKRLERQNSQLVDLAKSHCIATGDLKESVREIVEGAARTLDVEHVSVWLFNRTHSRVYCQDQYTLSTASHTSGEKREVSVNPAYYRALENERVISAHDARHDPVTKAFRASFLEPSGITSMLEAPIRLGGRLVGVLSHAHTGPVRRWNVVEQNLATSMADLISLAVEASQHRKSEKALQRREQIMEAVAYAAELLLKSTPWHGGTAEMLTRLGQATAVHRAVIVRRNGQGLEPLQANVLYEWMAPGKEIPKGMRHSQGIPLERDALKRWNNILMRGGTISGNTREFSHKERALLKELGLGSLVVVPIFARKQLWGLIEFHVYGNSRSWSDPEVDGLRTAASIVGEAIQRQRLDAQLVRLNETFLSLGPNFQQNLTLLTESCGELLNSSFAFYDRLENSSMYTIARWHAPKDLEFTVDSAEGRLPYDVLRNWAAGGIYVVQHLDSTSYADSDPIVVRHGVKTYAGHPVQAFGKCIGVLSAVYTENVQFDETQEKILEILATAIGIEEERRHAEETRARLSAAAEQAAEAIIVTDTDGTIQYVNPAFERITGYRSDEVCGKTPAILKSGRHDDAFYRNMWNTISRGSVWIGHFFNRKKDGTVYEEDGTISPVRDAAGRVVNYVAVKRDVTEQVTLQAQLQQSQKMEAVGQLAGGVAHDFNNLLTVITMNAEFLGMLLEDRDDVSGNIDEILNATENAANLTRQLMAFARKQTFNPSVTDLNTVVAQMEKMLRRLLREDIELTLNPAAEDLFPVEVDKGQIQQVLINLVVNARDAMHAGGRIVIESGNEEVRQHDTPTHAGVPPGKYVRLRVSDTGHGMDPEVQSHIFEPFYSTKAPDRGTGLGLATVYGIVKQHNGYITVDSVADQGTTFDVFLPVAEAVAETGEKDRKKKRRAPPRGTETILVVEDLAALRSVSATTLRRLGYTVLEAGDGEEALELATSYDGTIDLLFTDVIMPKMNGKVLAEKLKSERPQLEIIFASGYADLLTVRDLASRDDVRFLQKPFEPSMLAINVREMLDAASSPRQAG